MGFDRRKIESWLVEKEDWNVTKGERETLKRLSADTSLVIKPADKGSVVVVMNREQYVKEVNRQLEDQDFLDL